MASIEERFKAAVNVIKNLPKNGSYQPSTAMMLTFYGYYKQATEGPCPQSKPHFWDFVGKAKWDAWNSNRHLTKERAMELYVEELRKIIETMSYTANVANFVGSVSELDAVNFDDLEAVSPGIRELAQSHPNSPFGSRTNSPQHGVSANSPSSSGEKSIDSNSIGDVKNATNNYGFSPASSDELLTNPISYDMENNATNFKRRSTYMSNEGKSNNETSEISEDEYNDPFDAPIMELNDTIKQNSELIKQVQATVSRMNVDLSSINQRLNSIEKCIEEVRNNSKSMQSNDQRIMGSNSLLLKSRKLSYPQWWPFDDISPSWFIFLVLWPIFMNRIARMILKRQGK